MVQAGPLPAGRGRSARRDVSPRLYRRSRLRLTMPILHCSNRRAARIRAHGAASLAQSLPRVAQGRRGTDRPRMEPMRAQSAMLVDAVPDRSPLGWLILLPLGCLVLGAAAAGHHGHRPGARRHPRRPDGYMRLNRVLALHDGGDWFDSRYLRINPPEGHVQHWTRPLDALLLAGGLLLEPIFGFAAGLHRLGRAVQPGLPRARACWRWPGRPSLCWTATPGCSRAWPISCSRPCSPIRASAGRTITALLLLLFVILLGLTFRLLTDPLDRRSARLAGAIAALSLWISLESMTFVGVQHGGPRAVLAARRRRAGSPEPRLCGDDRR